MSSGLTGVLGDSTASVKRTLALPDRDRVDYHHAIDGLRAVAVLFVVFFHAELPGFTRGYLGVDMFLAISGFLITPRLLRRPGDGHLQPLRQFWAARVRRIIPAVTLVIIVTCIGSAIVLAPQELKSVGIYGLASDLFAVNILAASRGGNYFAGPLRDSPFLQMWSLGLEEQFYLVWPLVLSAVTIVTRRKIKRRTASPDNGRLLLWVLLVSIVGSFLLHAVWSRTLPLWAFYSLPTRMYEFLLGGAAALFVVKVLPGSFRVPTTLAGAVLVAVAVFAPLGFETSPLLTLAASAGTVLIMVGTAPRKDVSAPTTAGIQPVLESKPMAAIGRYSYSWYLWHWPAFVLVLAATNGTRVWAQVACIASIIPAMAAFHFVEQPFRLSKWHSNSPRRAFVMGGALVALGAVASVGLIGWGKLGLKDPQTASYVAAEESFRPAGCAKNDTDYPVAVCIGGSMGEGDPEVLFVGDSHAGHWVAAMSELGEQMGFTLVVRWLGNCAGTLPEPGTDRASKPGTCAEFQMGTAELISTGDFDAVIVSDATSSRPDDPEKWGSEFAALDAVAEKAGVPVGRIVDNPQLGEVLRCVSRGGTQETCSRSRSEATADIRRYRSAADHLEREQSVRELDLTDQICPTDPCPVRVDGVIVPARDLHLNRDFTLTQLPQLGEFVSSLIGSQ